MTQTTETTKIDKKKDPNDVSELTLDKMHIIIAMLKEGKKVSEISFSTILADITRFELLQIIKIQHDQMKQIALSEASDVTTEK